MTQPLVPVAVSFALGVLAARQWGIWALAFWVAALLGFLLSWNMSRRHRGQSGVKGRTAADGERVSAAMPQVFLAESEPPIIAPFTDGTPGLSPLSRSLRPKEQMAARDKAVTIFLLLVIALVGSLRLYTFDLFSAGNIGLWANQPVIDLTVVVLQVSNKGDRLVYHGRATSVLVQGEKRAAWGQLQFLSDGLFAYGDLVQIRGRLKPPSRPRNPGEFDYADYLRRQGIHMVMEVDPGDARLVGRGWGNPLIAWAFAARQRLTKVMASTLPSTHAALLTGIALGGSEGLPSQIEEAFRRTGSYHILAVSGSNVAFVVGVVLGLLKYLSVHRKPAAFLALLSVVGYVFLTGAGPSVARAGVMAALALLGVLVARRYDVFSALAAAALTILGYNPYDLWDIGFQLSFAATLGIVTLSLPPNRLALPRWLTEILSITLAAQLAVAPLSLLYFQRLSVVALVANLVIVPLAGGLVVMAFLLGLGGLLFPPLALVINQVVYFPLEALLRVVAWFASFPLAEVSFPLPWWGVGLSYLGLIFLFRYRQEGRKQLASTAPFPRGRFIKSSEQARGGRMDGATDEVPGNVDGGASQAASSRSDWQPGQRAAPSRGRFFPSPRPSFTRLGLFLILILLFLNLGLWGWLIAPWRGDVLQVTFLDVGQGDATFLRFPGGQTMLIDAGGWSEAYPKDYDPGAQVILPFLQRQGIKKLDFLILSHPHEDHIGGMPAILEGIGVAGFYQAPEEIATWLEEAPSADSSLTLARQSYERVQELLRQKGIPRHILQRGDRLEVTPELTLFVLHPGQLANEIRAKVNNNSLVLKLVYKKVSFLFTGDLEKEGEDEVLARFQGLQSSFLKVGHHGSRTSSQASFLKAVRPQAAIISVGRNFYGHPHPATRHNLQEAGAKIYRTDQDGAVTVETDGQKWLLKTTKK
ncbi:MAG: ComEC/Rec2 family competence protein [Firmicutes bacterium]|nr:ComEC/Rec2 family competence protein [Bacillota bacterium]MCL5039583.1 ComEC/Rec2 family competence protein [Bacillota bacterium]